MFVDFSKVKSEGPQGPMGPQGPQGEPGPQGPTGEVDYSRLNDYATITYVDEKMGSVITELKTI